jgi:hypothetical protein
MYIRIPLRELFILLALTLSSMTGQASDRVITIQAGTSIPLQLRQPLSSYDVTAGDTIEFRVQSDVIIRGRVVIPVGSIAVGLIKKNAPVSPTSCAELVIEFQTVQTIDHQTVPLSQMPVIIMGGCCNDCNKPIVLDQDIPFSAEVPEDISVALSEKPQPVIATALKTAVRFSNAIHFQPYSSNYF